MASASAPAQADHSDIYIYIYIYMYIHTNIHTYTYRAPGRAADSTRDARIGVGTGQAGAWTSCTTILVNYDYIAYHNDIM